MNGKLKFITQDDQDKVNQFLYSFAEPFFRHYLPSSWPLPPLYHYTTGDSLIRIIESQELLATQAACLNDMTELTHAADQLRELVKMRNSDAPTSVTAFRSRLAEVLLNPYPETSGRFVTCFTEKRDDLSQWRSYSGGEGGYAIQFDTMKLLASAIPLETKKVFLSGGPSEESQFWQPLVQVAYKLENVDKLIDFGERCVVESQGARRAPTENDWLEEFTTYWIDQIGFFAACVKHPKFESEKEWRFLYSLRPEDIREKRLRFRQRPYMMTRHVPLLLKRPLPITGVIVGPCRHPQLSKIAVGDLLKAHEYDPDVVRVELTEVPYRA